MSLKNLNAHGKVPFSKQNSKEKHILSPLRSGPIVSVQKMWSFYMEWLGIIHFCGYDCTYFQNPNNPNIVQLLKMCTQLWMLSSDIMFCCACVNFDMTPFSYFRFWNNPILLCFFRNLIECSWCRFFRNPLRALIMKVIPGGPILLTDQKEILPATWLQLPFFQLIYSPEGISI